MITITDYGQHEDLFGRTWIRTNMTIGALALIEELADAVDFADEVNATVLEGTGLQVCMQANGWAYVDSGANGPGSAPEYVAAVIDVAIEMISEEAR